MGSWPSLHDAEIIKVELERNGDPVAVLTIKAMPYHPSGKSEHSLIKVRFLDVSDMELFDWNEQNVVFGLYGKSYGEGTRLIISASYRLAGTFYFREAQVLECRRVPTEARETEE